MRKKELRNGAGTGPASVCTAPPHAGQPRSSPKKNCPALLPGPLFPYDLPIYANPKVHRDHYIEVARALYSLPGHLIGQRVEARADRSTRAASTPAGPW